MLQKPEQHYLEQMLFQLCNVQPKPVSVSKSKAVGRRKAKLCENHVKMFFISHILSLLKRSVNPNMQLQGWPPGFATSQDSRGEAKCRVTILLSPGLRLCCTKKTHGIWARLRDLLLSVPHQSMGRALDDITGQTGGGCSQPAPGCVESFSLPVSQEQSPMQKMRWQLACTQEFL